MNEIANKFLLTGDKFMPEMQLKQAESTYSAWDSRYERYQRGLVSMAYIFFDKKSKGSGFKSAIKQKWHLAEELHQPIITKF